MEALPAGELSDGPGRGIAFADALNSCEVFVQKVSVDLRPQSLQAVAIKADARRKIVLLETEDKNPCIDELLALHARHDAENCIIKGRGNGHPSPPAQRYVRLRAVRGRN